MWTSRRKKFSNQHYMNTRIREFIFRYQNAMSMALSLCLQDAFLYGEEYAMNKWKERIADYVKTADR